MSFLIAPLEALTDSRLSDPERRVLLALYSFRNKNADTVWPSAEAIAARARIGDRTWISKLTKLLSEKGWLTKKRRGFTGGIEYALSVPDFASDELSNLDSQSKSVLESQSKLGPASKLDSGTLSKLDSEPKNVLGSQSKLGAASKLGAGTLSNLDSEPKNVLESQSKYKELQSEQQREHKNIKQKKSRLDYSSWPAMPDEQIFADWLDMRKRKRAAVSQTVVDQFGKELTRAVAAGYTVSQCLAECVTRNWQGFKFEWIQNSIGVTNHAPNQRNRGKTWAERQDDLTDAVTNYERATNF